MAKLAVSTSGRASKASSRRRNSQLALVGSCVLARSAGTTIGILINAVVGFAPSIRMRAQHGGSAHTGLQHIDMRHRVKADQRVRVAHHAFGEVGMQIERSHHGHVGSNLPANILQHFAGDVWMLMGG